MLLRVRKNNKFGYIDYKGNLIIDFYFDFASDFKEGLARVQIKNKWFYINELGNEVFNLECGNCMDFNEGFASFELNRKYGFINNQGKIAIPNTFEHTFKFENGLALVRDKSNPKGKFIDYNGKEVLKDRMFLLSHYSEGLINVPNEKGKWGYIDLTNEFVIKPKYNQSYQFSEGLAAVLIKRDYCGFINKKGEEVIPPIYQGADIIFSEGFCPLLKIGDKYWGYINTKGEEVIPFQFKYAGNFRCGRAVVQVKGSNKYCLIDYAGNFITKSIYQSIEEFFDGYSHVIIGDEYDKFLYGIIDIDGNYIWEPTR